MNMLKSIALHTAGRVRSDSGLSGYRHGTECKHAWPTQELGV